MYACCFSEEIYVVQIPRENWQCLQRDLISIVVSMECCYYIKAMYNEALIVF